MKTLLVILCLATATPPPPAESLLAKLLRITGISATPSQQKGPGDEMESGGVIWLSEITTRKTRQLSAEGGFRSPIFAPNDQSILASKAGALWQISLSDGAAKKLHDVPGLTKLIGIDRDNPDRILILLRRDATTGPALLSLSTGRTTVLPSDPNSPNDRKLLNHLTEWERVYGETKVYPKEQRREGIAGPMEWQDVFLQEDGNAPINLSHCDGDNCGQPSLSGDGSKVVFVRAPP